MVPFLPWCDGCGMHGCRAKRRWWRRRRHYGRFPRALIRP